jgi:hypothetical protein
MFGMALVPVTAAKADSSTPPPVLNPLSPSAGILGAEIPAVQALESYAINEVLSSHGLPTTSPETEANLSWSRDDIRAAEFAVVSAIIEEPPATRAGAGLLGNGQDQTIYNWFQRVVQQQLINDAQQAINEFFRWSGFTSLNEPFNPLNRGLPQSYPGGYGNGASVPTGYCNFVPPGPFAGTYSAQNAEDCYIPCTEQLTDCFPPEPTLDQFEQWGLYDNQQKVLGSKDYLPAAGGAAIAEGAGVAAALEGFTSPITKVLSGSSPLLVKFGTELAPHAIRAIVEGGIEAATKGAEAGAEAAKAAFQTAAEVADVAATAMSASLVAGIVGVVIDFIISTVLAGITLNQQLTEPQKLQAVLTSAQNTPPDLAAILGQAGGTVELFNAFVTTTLPEAQIQCSINPDDDCYTPTPPPAHGSSDPSFLMTPEGSKVGTVQSTIYSVDPFGLYFNNTYLSGQGTFVTQRFNAYDAANATSPTDGGATVQSDSFPYSDWSGNHWSAERLTDASGDSEFALTPTGTTNADACAKLPDGTSPCLTDTLQIQVPGSGGVPFDATVRVLSAASLQPKVAVSYSTPAVAGTAITFSPNGVDPSNLPLTYTWSFPISGNQACIQYGTGYCKLTTTSVNGPTTWTFLAPGDYEASVDAQDGNGYSTTEQFSVAVTSTTTTVVASSAAPSVSTQPVTFTATVTPSGGGDCPNVYFGPPVTGYVQFALDGVDYGDPVELQQPPSCGEPADTDGTGMAAITIPNLGVNPSGHAVTATYYGSQTYDSSTSGAFSQVVNPESDTTTITPTDPTIFFGSAVIFKAAVVPVAPGVGTPTGTVQFYADGHPLGKAVAVGFDGTATSPRTTSLQVDKTNPGYDVTAIYSGDGTFPSSTGHFLENVEPDPTLTTVNSSVNPSALGEPVTFTAKVTAPAPGRGTPTGCVQFAIDGTNIGSPVTLDVTGTATHPAVTSMALTGAGSAYPSGHNVTASYLGLDDTCQQTVLNFSYETSGGTLPRAQLVDPTGTPTVSGAAAPSTLSGPFTFSFYTPVQGIDASGQTNVSVVAAGSPLAATVVCKNAKAATVSCSSGPTSTALLFPNAPLVAGEVYVMHVNASGSAVVGTRVAKRVPTFQKVTRAQTVFTSGQYPLHYAWGTVQSTVAVGGSFIEDPFGGAYVVTKLKLKAASAPSVVLYTGPAQGIATVAVYSGATLVSTNQTDTYAPAPGRLTQTLGSLGPGTYSVRVTVSGSRNSASAGAAVGLDAVIANGFTTKTPKVTADWSTIPDGSGGSYRFTTQTGASLTLAFYGTGISWKAFVGPNDGIATVSIDGNVFQQDLYANKFGFATFSYGGLPNAPHTLTITVAGARDALSTDNVVTVDGITVH